MINNMMSTQDLLTFNLDTVLQVVLVVVALALSHFVQEGIKRKEAQEHLVSLRLEETKRK